MLITLTFVRAARFSLMTMLAALAMVFPAFAQIGVGANNIAATLIAESATPQAGSRVTIAIDLRPKPGWHGYWRNPGEAGFAARLEWALPKGATISEPLYPVPERLVVAGLMNHVFNGNHALLATLTVPAGLAGGTPLPVRLAADWLACTDEICVPEHADLALTLTVGNGAIDPAATAQFDRWRAALPRPIGQTARFMVDGKRLRIGVPIPASAAIADPWLFSATPDAINYATPQQISRDGDMLIIETDAGAVKPDRIDAVLAIGKGAGLEVRAVPGAVARAGGMAGDLVTIALALGGAILGGLLLNVMPCVFPVISLKALSLARAGGDERAAKHEALAYSAGVIAVCLLLGGLLLGLRAGGASVGWAFQLQEPRVIIVLLLLSVAIALNLAGVFELSGFGGGQTLVDQGGTRGAFWTGALAAFVATPCTGPFMGAALGAALVLPLAAALAIFAGLGLGLALPFLLLGYVPAFRRMMPRPGPWMATFQRWLSVPMFLTAAALVWLLSRQAGMQGLTIGLIASLAAAAALWAIGRAQHGGKPVNRAVFGALAMIAIAAPLAIGMIARTTSSIEAGKLAAEPFSEARLAALRAQGRPVFVYFTADWCLTCKVNETAAIERDDVASAFKAQNTAVLVGDWTNGDATITRFLTAHGASGVPLYLWYGKGAADPRTLPQVLTPATLTTLR